jgi:polyhydroxybutyrate depolymerase
MNRILRISTYVVALAVAAILVAYVTLVRFPRPKAPRLTGRVEHGTLRVGDRTRSFGYYAPAPLPPNPPLVIAMHPSGERGDAFRWQTGYSFDRLADAHGFVVVYPDGYEGHWNTCRKVGSDSAHKLHVDDIAFVRALIDHFHSTHGIDRGRVFATGHSNGGQMSYRLALEMPDEVRAVAAISAALPVPENLDCRESGKAVPVLVMNGTRDPINPYDGGRVTIFGFSDRGDVRSSVSTATYFASLGALAASPNTERLPGEDAGLWVERSTWGSPATLEVVLDTIHGGGHVVPQGVSRYPRILGPTDSAFDGPAEIWAFFARQPVRKARGE